MLKGYPAAGGTAVAEWLKNNIADFVASNWQDGNAAPYAINEAFQQVCCKPSETPKPGRASTNGSRPFAT